MIFSIYLKANKEDIIIIPDNSLRFRVIANSNSLEDYQIKEEVKIAVEKELIEILKPADSLEETKKIVNNNLTNIENIISNTLYQNKDFNINLGNNFFPKKIFKSVVYPEGYYDSLVITIGKGKGENWWCVLFPPLCLLEKDKNTTDVEYKFYVTRILDYFK